MVDVKDSCSLLEDEVFGHILSVMPVDGVKVIEFVNERGHIPCPFTYSGTMKVRNDTLWTIP